MLSLTGQPVAVINLEILAKKNKRKKKSCFDEKLKVKYYLRL